MPKVIIQFQPQRGHTLDEIKISDYLNNLGLDIEVTEGFDTGAYTNFVIETDNVAALWNNIKIKLHSIPGFDNTTIVTCEGTYGWDDYLLLHHFDPEEPLDEL
jgi:hypothetical protein